MIKIIANSKSTIIVLMMVGFVALGVACAKQTDGNEPMPINLPTNFPKPVYNLEANPITKAGFELGRKLFYDPILSRDSTISCGSCHIQGSAFTHHGHDVSHGIEDKLGTRNTPAVMNMAWNPVFFWDGGIFHLDLLPIAPIENPVEMDEHLPNIFKKLQQHKQYPQLFAKAFGTTEITSKKTFMAMSQFMLHCISANSQYDKYIRKEGYTLTSTELAGKQIFEQKCANCHSTDLFTDNQFHNNGLAPSIINYKGRYLITLQEKDKYLFKTPSLRNIAITAPYMHDGRFRTLEAVLNHYSSEVIDSETLDPLLKKEGKLGIPLTTVEKQQLIAFLNTLTDESFLRDPKLAEQ